MNRGRAGRAPRVENGLAQRRRRAQGGRLLLILALGSLSLAFFRVQVLESSDFMRQARRNRLKPVIVPATRGVIYDRDGAILAHDIPGYRIELDPTRPDSFRSALTRLERVIYLSPARVHAAEEAARTNPNLPVPVVPDASPEAVARVEERLFLLHGVRVVAYPKRHYPAGQAAAHVVGYLGEASPEQVAAAPPGTYRPGQLVGQAGLERDYQAVLAGHPGVRYLETDAAGRIVRALPLSDGLAPKPGHDLHLYLDLDLQRYVASQFADTAIGAFVALDPATGGVLALYSQPTFDPNRFIDGLSAADWQRLAADPDHPLLDRAIASPQPPGSTWKPVVAALALERGILDPRKTMPIPCSGGLMYDGRYFRCWGVHGFQDLTGAIRVSCDVYFYQLGLKFTLAGFLDAGRAAGLTALTGIDLPGEVASRLPGDTTWWQQHLGYEPDQSEVLSLAIGQGPTAITPIKLAQLYTALARPDGRAPAPRLARRPGAPDTATFQVSGTTAWWLQRGMRRVLASGGTAALSRLRRWDFMGKTGTAQDSRGPDDAWFAGIAGPSGGSPEIVAVLFLQGGRHGSAAAEIVARAVDHYLSRLHGLAPDPYPTPRSRLAAGKPVDWAWAESPVQDPPEPASLGLAP